MNNFTNTAQGNFVSIETSLRNSYTTSFFLVVLALFIHPYILTIIATVFQLWFYIKPRFFLPVYAISLALFWSSRNIGISIEGLLDDAIAYTDQFNSIGNENLLSLVKSFIKAPSNNEILYTLFVYTIHIFTADEHIFIFIIYLLIASLISIAAVLVHRRYFMVYIAALFFGLGSFAELEILHLWRSAIASLLLLIGVLYYSKNKQVAISIMICAFLVHIFAIFLTLVFLTLQLNYKLKNKFIIPVISFLFFFAFAYMIESHGNLINYFSGKDVISTYFTGDKAVIYTEWIKLLMIVILFYYIKNVKFDYKDSFIISGQVFVILAYYSFPSIAFSGRLYQAFIVFTALMFFEIIMRINNKYLLSFILIFFFATKFNTMANGLFMQKAYADFSNIFSGILFTWLSA